MRIAMFAIGLLLFLGLTIIIRYWIVNGDHEKTFKRIVVFTYCLGALLLFFQLGGHTIFEQNTKNWIMLAASTIAAVLIIMHVIIYSIFEDFKIQLLLLMPPLVFEIWGIITAVQYVSVEVTFNKVLQIISISLCIIILITELLSFISRKQSSKIKSDLLYSRYSRSNSYLPFELYIHNSDLSGNMPDRISYLVLRLYQYAKLERLSPKRLKEILARDEEVFPPSIQNKVIERFMESHYLNRMESVSLLEFATILFPEFFDGIRKANSSSNYNLRLFEEFYLLSQKNLERTQGHLEELSSKMERIEAVVAGNTQHFVQHLATEKESTLSQASEDTCQSIVRELYHLIKTPLLTISLATNSILSDQEHPLSDAQKSKFSTIMDNVLATKLIIEAYRRLVTAHDISTSDDIVTHIKTSVSSMSNVCNKQIEASISDFPEKISVHGNNVIIILLMPLIHNAIEASPDGGEIEVICTEQEENYIITVVNSCEILPKHSDLKRDGYTTKNDGGEGLRSVRRISKSIGIEFHIKVNSREKKVVATLRVPRK